MCLQTLEKTGLNTKVVMCDQGPNNQHFLLTLKQVSISRSYMMQNSQNVYITFGSPHSLKNIRNNLKKSNLKHDGCDIHLEHTVAFFGMDKKRSLRIAQKLITSTLIFLYSMS